MFEKKCVRILGIIVVLIAFISFNTNVFGAINENYYKDIVNDLNVIEGNLNSKVSQSVLLDAIGILVYAVGSMMEWVLGLAFQGISGSNVFPWADAILFNAIPLLDVNIFNPSGASLVKIMQEFIASSYWTVFSLALSFLGIAIMVSAIKLAVSTIASDKALYKKAITKWLMAFVMLWGIHFFMSFVLYLNEALVETASKMAQESTAEYSINLAHLRDTSQSDAEIVANFVAAMSEKSLNFKQIAGGAAVVVGLVVIVAATIATGGAAGISIAAIVGGTSLTFTGAVVAASGTTYDINEFIGVQSTVISSARQTQYEYFKGEDLEFTVEWLGHEGSTRVAARLLKNSDYVNSLQAVCKAKLSKEAGSLSWDQQNKSDAIYYLAADVSLVLKNEVEIKVNGKNSTIDDYNQVLKNYLAAVNSISNSDRVVKVIDDNFQGYTIKKNGLKNTELKEEDVNYDQSLVWYCNGMIYARESYESEESTGDVPTSGNVITTLAKTFKDMAWSSTDRSWSASKISVQGALLYAILVAQSLIFFIAYTKRLFYVIILILLAPIVVVYDFFTKFSS